MYTTASLCRAMQGGWPLRARTKCSPTPNPWGEGCHLRMCSASHSQIAMQAPVTCRPPPPTAPRLMFGDQAAFFKNEGTGEGLCFSLQTLRRWSTTNPTSQLPVSSRQYLLATLLQTANPKKKLGMSAGSETPAPTVTRFAASALQALHWSGQAYLGGRHSWCSHTAHR